jgi:hypothetical protein
MKEHVVVLGEIKRIIGLIIAGGRLSYRTERDLHDVLSKRIGDQYIHEFQLAKDCRLDFFNPESGIVIEVKIKRHIERDLFYQIERYTQHEEVKGCLLIAPFFTGKIPDIVNGTPVVCCDINNLML